MGAAIHYIFYWSDCLLYIDFCISYNPCFIKMSVTISIHFIVYVISIAIS